MAWWNITIGNDDDDETSRGFSDPDKALDFAFLADGYGHDVKMFELGDSGVKEIDWWNNGAGWDPGGD